MNGMKVRVQDSALMERMIQLLGAIPVPLDYDQVYSAFQTDEIDAAAYYPKEKDDYQKAVKGRKGPAISCDHRNG